MKIIVTIFPTNLVPNSLLSLFCLFAETKDKNKNVQQVDSLVTKNISGFFIASRALFQRYAQFNRVL